MKQRKTLKQKHYKGRDYFKTRMSDHVLFGLASPANVNAKDKKGRTALHRAILRGNARWVQHLLSYDACTAIKDHQGMSPMELALESGNRDVIRLLRLANIS